MTNLDYYDVINAIRQLEGHVTSSKVTKGFLLITPYRKRYNRENGLIVFSSSRRIEWYTWWPRGHVTWGQPLTLTFRGQHIYVPMRIDERNTIVLFVLSWLHYFKRYLRKTLLTSSAAILTFLTPVTSSLTWPENDLSKNCRACPFVSYAVYRLSLSCSVSEILGGALIRHPPSVLSWRGPPSVRGLTLILGRCGHCNVTPIHG